MVGRTMTFALALVGAVFLIAILVLVLVAG